MYKHISCVQNTSFPMTWCLKYHFNFLLRRLSIIQHCLHQIIILRLFGKLIQSSKVTTWKNFSIFHFKSFSLKSLCSMFSFWNNVRDTKGYADKTYIRPTSTKDFTWTLIFKGKINFKSFFFKTTLSHISHGCLGSFNDNIDVAILLNMMLHVKG